MLTLPKFYDEQVTKDLKESMSIKGGKKRKSKKRRNIKRKTIKRKITKKNIKKSKNYSKRQKYIFNGGVILKSGKITTQEEKQAALLDCGVNITDPTKINDEYKKYASTTPFVDNTSPDVNSTKLYINILDGNRLEDLIPTPKSYMDLDFWFGHIGISIDDSMFEKYPQYLEYKGKVFGFGPDLHVDPVKYLNDPTQNTSTDFYDSTTDTWTVDSEKSNAFEQLSYKMYPTKKHSTEDIKKLYFGNLTDDTAAFMFENIVEKPYVLQSRNKVKDTDLLNQRTCIRIPVLTEFSLKYIIENYIEKYKNNVKIENGITTVKYPDIRYGVISNQPCYGENNVNATIQIGGIAKKISVYNCITFPCDKLQLFTYKKYKLNNRCTFIKESVLSVGIGRCGQVWTIDTYFKSPNTEIYSNKGIEQWNFFSRRWEEYNDTPKTVPTGPILIKQTRDGEYYIKSVETNKIFRENGDENQSPPKYIQDLFL
jgi:hypothetical protein